VKQGFTLIEVIIVMAIISLLAAVTIPTLARMGAFSRDDVNDAARDLYGLMRAARMYASTHRVDTAVVYVLNAEEDSRNSAFGMEYAPQFVADSVAMARRLSLDEVRQYIDETAGPNSEAARHSYVLVDSIEGRMWSLPGNARVRAAIEDVALWMPDPDNPDHAGLTPQDSQLLTGDNRPGLYFVRVFRLDNDNLSVLEPRAVQLERLIDDGWTELETRFPAHVFRPSGELRTSGQPERPQSVVTVGTSPSADVRERFVRPDSVEIPFHELAAVRIVLNHFSGRVVVERE